jgi:hypothetical protein
MSEQSAHEIKGSKLLARPAHRRFHYQPASSRDRTGLSTPQPAGHAMTRETLAAAVMVWLSGALAGWCAGWVARGDQNNRAWYRMNHPGFRTSFQSWKDGAMPSRYDKDIGAKAVRLVRDHVDDYETDSAFGDVPDR